MSVMASQITVVSFVRSTVSSDADQRKHQSSAWLTFVRGIHRWPLTKGQYRGTILYLMMSSGIPEGIPALDYLNDNWVIIGHGDVIKWKHFLHYWRIHRSAVNSPHKGQWRRALMFSLIRASISGWVSNREAVDLRRHRAHNDVIVMVQVMVCHFLGTKLNSNMIQVCHNILSFLSFWQNTSSLSQNMQAILYVPRLMQYSTKINLLHPYTLVAIITRSSKNHIAYITGVIEVEGK